MLTGVTLCGWAVYHRENNQTAAGVRRRVGGAYLAVMLLAVISGLLAALLNIALAFGGEIVERARAEGAPSHWAVFSVWPLALLGGLIVNLAYSWYLLSRNYTWRSFLLRFGEIGSPVLDGAVCMVATAIYSTGTVFLGMLGVSVGWAQFQITVILSGNLAGIWTGEWRAARRPIFMNLAGMGMLLIATIMVATANSSARVNRSIGAKPQGGICLDYNKTKIDR